MPAALRALLGLCPLTFADRWLATCEPLSLTHLYREVWTRGYDA